MDRVHWRQSDVVYAAADQIHRCPLFLPHPPDPTTVSVRFVDPGDLTRNDVLEIPKKPGIFQQGEIVPDAAEIERARRFLEQHFVNHYDVFYRTMRQKELIYPSPWFYAVFKRVKSRELEGKLKGAVRNWSYIEAILQTWIKRSGPDFDPVDALYDDSMRKVETKSKTDAKTESLREAFKDMIFE